MIRKVAKFEKVTFQAFFTKVRECGFGYNEEECKEMYDNIKLPQRATKGSAGYDFFIPFSVNLPNGVSKAIPTGIRCKMDEDVVLMLYPRSGLGFKYGISLVNTTGVIDSDYYYADNEGHIMVKFRNPGDRVELESGKAIMQGVFMPYFITEDDEVERVRTGGFGSTGNC